MKKAFGVVFMMFVVVLSVSAKTENGNDLALYLDEAKDNKKQFDLLASETGENNYYFRYLEIVNMDSGRQNGAPFIHIKANEPSSYFTVEFTVTKSVSLQLLMQEPVSKPGEAIAVTGKIEKLDQKKRLIVLNPVIVRHKDRLERKRGKEMLYEVDQNAVYYSFTGAAGKLVQLKYADRDLLPGSDEPDPVKAAKILADAQKNYTKAEWADHLLAQIAVRDEERRQQANRAAINAGIVRGATNAPIIPE